MKKQTKIPPKPLKNKGGRPSKFDKIDLEQCKKLYLMGHTDYEVAVFFNINVLTLHRWKLTQEGFCNSIKDWKKAADERVERSLYERAVGYTHESEQVFCYLGEIVRAKTVKHYPGSEIAQFFWLKNRKPDQYRDKPAEPEDEDLKEAELTFTGVPMKGAKLPESMTRFLQN